MRVEERLRELHIVLPEAPSPVAAYVTYKKSGNLIFLSGQGPIVDGVAKYTGKVGAECDASAAYDAARLCGLNLLAQLKKAIRDLDRVTQVVSLRGFIASSIDFYDQPAVLNGTSELMIAVFGEKGAHARCALGVNVLPGNIPVEVEMVVEIGD